MRFFCGLPSLTKMGDGFLRLGRRTELPLSSTMNAFRATPGPCSGKQLPSSPLLAHRNRQAVGIGVLSEAGAEDLFRFAQARDLLLHHSPVKGVEVRHA